MDQFKKKNLLFFIVSALCCTGTYPSLKDFKEVQSVKRAQEQTALERAGNESISPAERDAALIIAVNNQLKKFNDTLAHALQAAAHDNTDIEESLEEELDQLEGLLKTIEMLGQHVSLATRLQALDTIKKAIPSHIAEDLQDKIHILRRAITGQPLQPGTTNDRSVARRKVFEKWGQEINQDSTDLTQKIETLKKMSSVAQKDATLIPEFYKKLNDVKKDFLIESGQGELTKDEEKTFQSDLEFLMGIFLFGLESVKLSHGRTFADLWIATTTEQKEQDELFEKLAAHIVQQFEKSSKENLEESEIKMDELMNSIEYLAHLLSPEVRLKTIKTLSSKVSWLQKDANRLIKEIQQKEGKS